jgi:hypothetical protein
MDEGDACLLCQSVHILNDVTLGFAHVDDYVGIGREQCFKVHGASAAVKLAEHGQVQIFLLDVQGGVLREIGGEAYHQLGQRGRT